MNARQPVSRYYQIAGYRFHVAEWPGEGDPVLMFHATGFHARVWDQVILQFPQRPVYAVDMLSHGQSDNIEPPMNWTMVGEVLAQLVEKLDLHRITGIGHSFGGHMMVRVAGLLPERFRAVLLLDPVIAEPALLKLWQQFGDLAPIAKRRNVWASPEEMMSAFSSRSPYDTWDRAVLEDYCRHGLLPAEAGEHFELACPPVCEANVYANIGSETIYDLIPKVSVPVRIVRARARNADDAAFDFRPSPTWPELSTKFAQAVDVHLDQHDHFFPMSVPALVVEQFAKLESQMAANK